MRNQFYDTLLEKKALFRYIIHLSREASQQTPERREMNYDELCSLESYLPMFDMEEGEKSTVSRYLGSAKNILLSKCTAPVLQAA